MECTSIGSLVLDIFRGPIQIVIGLLYGILLGLLLWVIPTKHFVSLYDMFAHPLYLTSYHAITEERCENSQPILFALGTWTVCSVWE